MIVRLEGQWDQYRRRTSQKKCFLCGCDSNSPWWLDADYNRGMHDNIIIECFGQETIKKRTVFIYICNNCINKSPISNVHRSSLDVDHYIQSQI